VALQETGGRPNQRPARKEETMNWRIAFILVAGCAALLAQVPETILLIETQNVVAYWEDNADQQQWATSATPVAAATLGNFVKSIWIGDIVAVNGKAAKGALVSQQQRSILTPAPTGSQGIADISRNLVAEIHLEILQADGTHVGSLLLSGIGGGSPALGVPGPVTAGLFVVVGGTGAFLGVRGQASTVSQTLRRASITENPINRRTHPGAGAWSLVIHLIPMTQPEVLAVPTGPAIFHTNDFSPVTPEKPARAGELLTMSVSRLGPVRPNLDPGTPFPPYDAGKPYVVNSPVEVTVNGKASQVVNALGWPTLNNVYRVDFVVPDGTAAGMATLGLSVAWINGPEVKFPVR